MDIYAAFFDFLGRDFAFGMILGIMIGFFLSHYILSKEKQELKNDIKELKEHYEKRLDRLNAEYEALHKRYKELDIELNHAKAIINSHK